MERPNAGTWPSAEAARQHAGFCRREAAGPDEDGSRESTSQVTVVKGNKCLSGLGFCFLFWHLSRCDLDSRRSSAAEAIGEETEGLLEQSSPL